MKVGTRNPAQALQRRAESMLGMRPLAAGLDAVKARVTRFSGFSYVARFVASIAACGVLTCEVV
jgi:hypothetical protein